MKSSERKEIKKKKKEQKSASREEKRIKKSKPFEKVIKRSINVYSILLIVLAGALALFICFQLMGMKYGYDAQRLAEVAATYVDGDTIDKYLEIAEKGDAEAAENDEEYKKVREKLDNLCYAAGLTDIYIYIYKEEEKEVVVLWHVVEKDAGKEARPIGTRAKVDKEIQKKIDEGRKGGRGTLDYLERYNMEMEPAISAMRAVTDGYGDMVAMASAEFEISWSYVWIIIFSLCFFPPLIILALIFNFIYKRSVKRKIVKPIKRLAKATTELVDKLESDEEIAVRTKSRVTEFNDLAVAFTSMGNDLRNYVTTITDITAEKERIATELNVASRIQADLLPSIFPPFPERREVDIYASMNPAKEVGGDFYDFFWIDEDNLAMVIGDVSGKGVPAALFMVIGKTLIKEHTIYEWQKEERRPERIFEDVNNILCESNKDMLFITALECILNVKTGELIMINAGHDKPYIKRGKGNFEIFKTSTTLVLAMMSDQKYTVDRTQLNPGDKLFIYTDGIPEATNRNNEMYGADRLKRILDLNKKQSQTELLGATIRDVYAFEGDAPQFDDITMLGVEYKG